MPRLLLILLVLVFYALHQDVWLWRAVHPIAFGVLPAGLFYHAAYTLAISGLMWLLVRFAWPGHLDDDETPRLREPGARERGDHGREAPR
jgi:hypothetical protein